MPQLDLINTTLVPWRVTFEFTEDPLSPSSPTMATMTIYDAKNHVLEQETELLPRRYSVDAFSDMVRDAMFTYEATTARNAARVWNRSAKLWIRVAEEQAQTR